MRSAKSHCRWQITAAVVMLATAVASTGLMASEPSRAHRTLEVPSDSADAVATIAKFHAALAAGDSTGALAVLAPDALIVESGGVETRAEYRAHHLPADIDFARVVPSTRTVTRVTVQGDVAWVTSTSVTQGQANGRQINSAGAELVVLRRSGSGWQISAIHWSSRTRRST